MNEEDLNINLDDEDFTDELKDEFKKSGKVHIHKTSDDGEDVDIDIDKNKKSIDVKVDKEGEKTEVNIGLSGLEVNKDGKEKVKIQFLPIILFTILVLCAILFFIYKIFELIINSF